MTLAVTSLTVRELDRTPDLVELAGAARDAGHEVLLIELASEYADATGRVARQAVDLFDRHVRERIQSEGGETEAAERRLLELFNELLDASGLLVKHHFQRTLLRAAREHIEKKS